MFSRLGELAFRRAKLVLVISALAVIGFGVLGLGAFGKLLSGGSTVPGAPSTLAQAFVDSHFGGDPNLVFLIHARFGTVDSPAVAMEGRSLTSALEEEQGVTNVESYWSSHASGLRSQKGTDGLVVLHVSGTDQQAANRAKTLIARFSTSGPLTTVMAGGPLGVGNDVRSDVTKSLARAELIAVPVTLVLLLIVFASPIAALLPLALGVLAVLGTFAVLDLLAGVTSVSVYAINLTTALGLALGIDYALLGVSRFREELAAGRSVHDSVVRTVETAGRTVLFSAATVGAALASLLVFPIFFLRSFAYAGIGVVALAAVGGVLVLPALLSVLGERVNKGRLGWLPAPNTDESVTWRRIASFAMRRPLLVVLPSVLVLIVLASPLGHVAFANPSAQVLATGAPSRTVSNELLNQFPTDTSSAIDVVSFAPVAPGPLGQFAAALSALPHARTVSSSAGTFRSGHLVSAAPVRGDVGAGEVQQITVAMDVGPDSGAAQRLVVAVRAQASPAGVRTLVGGPTAALVDTKRAIGARLPLAGLLIVLTSFLLLMLFTGTVVQPIRALLFNALGLSAVLGVMVWVFQEGHFSSFFGFTPGPLDTSMPVLLFCIAFGLSMDYEVFVISRIKERHDAGASTKDAVVGGLGRSGRIVSTAAVLMAVSFFAFGAATVSFIQFFGLGTGLAILVDATLMRGVLMPASFRLLGEHSWYSPPFLRRLDARLGLSERESPVLSSDREHSVNHAPTSA